MNTLKATPGPWDVVRGGDGVVSVEGCGYVVATVEPLAGPSDYSGQDRGGHNANLLLSACPMVPEIGRETSKSASWNMT